MSFYDPSKILLLDPSERTIKRLFWRDNCEAYDVVKWPILGRPTTVCEYSQEVPAFEGDYVLKLDDTAFEFTNCQVRFGMFNARQRHSVELWWYRENNIHEMWVELGLQNGSQQRVAYIRHNGRTGINRWEYYDSSGNWVPVPGGNEYIMYDTWNRFKMVVDWANNRYVKMESTGLDLAMNAPLRVAASSVYYTRLRLYKDSDGFPAPIYFDDIRLYQNEVV